MVKVNRENIIKVSFYASMKLLGDFVPVAFLSPNLKMGKGIPQKRKLKNIE